MSALASRAHLRASDHFLVSAAPNAMYARQKIRRCSLAVPIATATGRSFGVLLMALLMGLGGGITRDLLINKVPGAITNPAYLIFARGSGRSATCWPTAVGRCSAGGCFSS